MSANSEGGAVLLHKIIRIVGGTLEGGKNARVRSPSNFLLTSDRSLPLEFHQLCAVSQMGLDHPGNFVLTSHNGASCRSRGEHH